jgi:hypothetical protein
MRIDTVDIELSRTAKMSFVKIQQKPSIWIFMIPPILLPRDKLDDPVRCLAHLNW